MIGHAADGFVVVEKSRRSYFALAALTSSWSKRKERKSARAPGYSWDLVFLPVNGCLASTSGMPGSEMAPMICARVRKERFCIVPFSNGNASKVKRSQETRALNPWQNSDGLFPPASSPVKSAGITPTPPGAPDLERENFQCRIRRALQCG